MTELVLTLPAPPSVNNLFATVGKKRVKSLGYKKWLAAAYFALLEQERRCIEGRVTLEILVERGRGDVSNRVKAPEDFLVLHGLIEDDKLVESVFAAWSDSIKGMQITVRAV